MTILNLQVQMQNIPAGGVLRYADSIRALQGTDISRILIVIKDDIVVQAQGIFSEMDDRLAPCRGSVEGVPTDPLWLATRIYFCPCLVSTAQKTL